MRRILFVDDEPRVLEGLENLLFPYMDDWEMEFVGSGAEALERLAQAPFDILVTDMRMPGMDGATLLAKSRDLYPRVARLALSGHAELEAVLRAMPFAHQFLSKPCEAERLINALTRACKVQDLIDSESVRNVLGHFGDLPVRPRVYSEIVTLLADERSSMADLAGVVEQDIAISAKVLHVANTAFFSRGRPSTTVRQAIPRLGSACVRDLVLSVEAFRGFGETSIPGFSIDALHNRSFQCAALASLLCDDKKEASNAFLAGMMQDLGELMLATTLPEAFAETIQIHRETGLARLSLERKVFGTTHAELGAYLLGLWGLTYPVIEAVAHHHHPAQVNSSDLSLVTILHVANGLADELSAGQPTPTLDLEHLEAIGVADRLDDWRALAQSTLEAES